MTTTNFFKLAACTAVLAAAQGVYAQDSLMDGATIHALGEPKEWTSNNDATYTFNTTDLEKALNSSNNANIYLFPETGGGWDNEANRTIGIQGFYVDLGSAQNIGVVTTTWEGAAADAYDIYVTDEVPTTAILSTDPTYTATGLGQYTLNTAVMPEGTKGQYVVFQPTNATNWGWGVKLRSITVYGELEADELSFFSIEPAFVFAPDTKLTFRFRNQYGLNIDADKVTVTCAEAGVYNADAQTLNLAQGQIANFTATLNGESLSYTVSYPNPPALPEDVKTAIYTPDVRNVQWQYGYNGPDANSDEEETRNFNKHDFANGEVCSNFHAVYCIFFYNPTTLGKYGAWNTLNIPNPVEDLGKYLYMSVYSSRTAPCAVAFNDDAFNIASHEDEQFKFDLPHDDWKQLVIDMSEAKDIKNMQIRFPEKHDLDCVLLSNIYFSDKAPEEDINTSVISASFGASDETVNVYTTTGVLLKNNVKKAEALEGLAKGLYIVGGKKVVK